MCDFFDAHGIIRKQKIAFVFTVALYSIGLIFLPEEEITKGSYLFITCLMVIFFSYMMLFHNVKFQHEFKVVEREFEGKHFYQLTPSNLSGKHKMHFIFPKDMLTINLEKNPTITMQGKIDVFGKVSPSLN